MKSLLKRIARRTAVITSFMSILVAAGIVGANPASACDINNHCYATIRGYPSGIDGVAGYINPDCLSATSGDFLTDEIWLADGRSSTYMWVEAGFIVQGSGVSINGIPGSGSYTFWGEKDPHTGYQFVGHVLAYTPSLASTYATIYRTSSTSFKATVGTWSGTSSSNTISPNYGELGSESSASSSTQAHGYGSWTGVEYRTGTWHSGVYNPVHVGPTAPQQFHWITQTTSFHAGIAC